MHITTTSQLRDVVREERANGDQMVPNPTAIITKILAQHTFGGDLRRAPATAVRTVVDMTLDTDESDPNGEYDWLLERADEFLAALSAFVDIEFDADKLHPADRQRFTRLLGREGQTVLDILTRLLKPSTAGDAGGAP